MKPGIGINNNGDDEDDTKIYFYFACIFTWFTDVCMMYHCIFILEVCFMRAIWFYYMNSQCKLIILLQTFFSSFGSN